MSFSNSRERLCYIKKNIKDLNIFFMHLQYWLQLELNHACQK